MPLKGTKVSLETRRKMSEIAKKQGRKPPSALGRKMTEKHKKLLRSLKPMLGKKHSEETKKKMSLTRKGRYFAPKHRQFKLHLKYKKLKLKSEKKVRQYLKGDQSPNWKGGITPINLSLRMSLKYRVWRDFVFQRDNWTCQSCQLKHPRKIEGHHIEPFSVLLMKNKIKSVEEGLNCEELWNVNNGLTLCTYCHKKTDSYGNKKLYTQWLA